MTFAADGNMTCKSYNEMDPRAFFAVSRTQTAPAAVGSLGVAHLDMTRFFFIFLFENN